MKSRVALCEYQVPGAGRSIADVAPCGIGQGTARRGQSVGRFGQSRANLWPISGQSRARLGPVSDQSRASLGPVSGQSRANLGRKAPTNALLSPGLAITPDRPPPALPASAQTTSLKA